METKKMKGWSDGKKFLLDDILVYSGILGGDLLFDLGCNFMHAVGLREIAQPYEFGIFQFIVLLFAGIQLARKIIDLRYYA
jgi:hypothetical protein